MPPLPKKKHTRARKGGRAAHHFLTAPGLSPCACSRRVMIRPHRACPECGHYKGRTMPGNWPSEDLLVATGEQES
jgi:large subunit ribosomal protein L32